MGAFFPAGLKLVIDGFLAAQTALACCVAHGAA